MFAIGATIEGIVASADRPSLETAQSFERILRPTDRFAEFAVAHHIDAGPMLPGDDVLHGLPQTCVVGGLVIGLARLSRADEVLQFRRPDQAADMRREDVRLRSRARASFGRLRW